MTSTSKLLSGIAAGADFRAPAADPGFTPLLFAARTGRTEVVRVLLKAGADLNGATKPAKKPGNKQPRAGTSALTFANVNLGGADPNGPQVDFALQMGSVTVTQTIPAPGTPALLLAGMLFGFARRLIGKHW